MFVKPASYLDPRCTFSQKNQVDEKTLPENLQKHQNTGTVNAKYSSSHTHMHKLLVFRQLIFYMVYGHHGSGLLPQSSSYNNVQVLLELFRLDPSEMPTLEYSSTEDNVHGVA